MQPRHANGRPPGPPNGYPQPPPLPSNGHPLPSTSEQFALHQDNEPLTPGSARQLAQPPSRHNQDQGRHAAGYQNQRQQPPSSSTQQQQQQQHRRPISPVKGQHTLTVNGTTTTPSSSSSSSAPPAASPTNSSGSRLSTSRQLILLLGVAALVLSLPLLYVLLSSSFITSALCSSAFLASTTLASKHLSPASPLSLLNPRHSLLPLHRTLPSTTIHLTAPHSPPLSHCSHRPVHQSSYSIDTVLVCAVLGAAIECIVCVQWTE